jgi:glucan phosphoethanolaminetransferase (alkaline phosphatase superfamily)
MRSGLTWLVTHRLLILLTVMVCAAEGIIATIGLHLPWSETTRSVIWAVPQMLSLVFFAAAGPWRVGRWLILVLAFAAADAEYTFSTYYAHFIGAGELHLLATNSLRELWASARLYFSLVALVAALLSAYAWFVLAARVDKTQRRPRLAISALLIFFLSVSVPETSTLANAAGSPLPSFVGMELHRGAQWLRGEWQTRVRRPDAPAPVHQPVAFDVIYLIGESLRADRFLPDEYGRNVTPWFGSLTLPHVRFSNVTSHGDCTGRSVPRLMVEPGLPLHIDQYRRPTLFAYAEAAGFTTAFFNANENDWAEFVDRHISRYEHNAEDPSAVGAQDFNDESRMLPRIAAAANAPGRQFIVVETYTAHWPYADRYQHCPVCRRYQPDLMGRPVPFEDRYRGEIVNSYDNAVGYFDRYVSALVSSLHKPTLIIFTSDHGESVGDDGRWGHCSAGPEQLRVPLYFIATDATVAAAAGLDRLDRLRDAPISHDHLFATLLDYLGQDVGSLPWPYPPGLRQLDGAGVPVRQSLVSEVGTGVEPVTTATIDPSGRRITLRSAVP